MKKIMVLSFLFLIPGLLFSNIIITVAGNGASGFADKTQAKNCMLNYPTGICIDEEGNIYIADSLNNRIRKVEKIPGDDYYEKSIMYTIAGNGDFGYDGTDIPATTTALATPKSVFAFKEQDHYEIYFSDSKNNLIRMINKTGHIKKIAGNLQFGYSGDNGPAEKAILANPNGIYIDQFKNVYIADTFNHRIRVIYNSGTVAGLSHKSLKKGYIYTVAGNGQPGAGGNNDAVNAFIGEPYDVWVDKEQNIYIAQRIGSVVSRVDAKTGKLAIVAGIPNQPGYNYDNKLADQAKLNQPFGVTLDQQKNLFIADGNNMRVRQVDYQGYIYTIAGQGRVGYTGDQSPARDSVLSFPLDVFSDQKGNLFISDSINSVIRMIIPGADPELPMN